MAPRPNASQRRFLQIQRCRIFALRASRPIFTDMNISLTALLASLILSVPSSALAQDSTAAPAGVQSEPQVLDLIQPAGAIRLEDFLWIKRPIVVFADSAADPRYVQQLQYLTQDLSALDLRDVVIITDTNPSERSAVRTALRPRGFMLAIIDKDGGVKHRKPLPWDVREISRAIDKMPTRQREIQERTNGVPRG